MRGAGAGSRGKRQPAAEIEDEDGDGNRRGDCRGFKRVKRSECKTMAEEYECPISHNLPIEPVTASDGKIYERKVIEEYIKEQGDHVISPCTRQSMNTEVFPALCVLNNIERGIHAGVYDGELAETWKQRMKMKKTVEDAQKKAEDGNVKAMRNLGDWYKEGVHELPKDEAKAEEWHDKAKVKELKGWAENGDSGAMYDLGMMFDNGNNGLKKDEAEAYRWFKQASDAGSVTGMALVGHAQINGWGTKKDLSNGLIRLVSAAKDGSDLACSLLGQYYYEGKHGVEKDAKQALYWLRMVVSGELKYKHLTEEYTEKARHRIRDIEGGG
mmetsp:Transcript_21711/g.62272  ORF Transcript_21711/g.62272 Transcript_21711/m.62272 type:complete len:327 (-) Transcript_21711:103-1083(-)